jgi:hypothetical protein
VAAVSSLLEIERWREVVAALEPVGAEPDADAWAERHETIYRSVAA